MGSRYLRCPVIVKVGERTHAPLTLPGTSKILMLAHNCGISMITMTQLKPVLKINTTSKWVLALELQMPLNSRDVRRIRNQRCIMCGVVLSIFTALSCFCCVHNLFGFI